MNCAKCGTEIKDSAKFCSTCGSALAAASLPLVPKRDWDLHVSLLGWILIAHAALTGLFGLIVMFGGAFVRQWILENPRVFEAANPRDVPPPEALALIGPITFLVGMLLLFVALPSVAAGVGLLRFRSWGRVLALVLSFLKVLEFPLGTLTAIYAFWVLLSRGGKEYYQKRAMQAEV